VTPGEVAVARVPPYARELVHEASRLLSVQIWALCVNFSGGKKELACQISMPVESAKA